MGENPLRRLSKLMPQIDFDSMKVSLVPNLRPLRGGDEKEQKRQRNRNTKPAYLSSDKEKKRRKIAQASKRINRQRNK